MHVPCRAGHFQRTATGEHGALAQTRNLGCPQEGGVAGIEVASRDQTVTGKQSRLQKWDCAAMRREWCTQPVGRIVGAVLE